MKKKLSFSILMLQALGLFGADYTAEDVAQMLDKLQVVLVNLPKDLPAYAKLDAAPVACSKCGKEMVYAADINLMDALVAYINRKNELYTFELDKSRVCPHCGDGMAYLKTSYKNNPANCSIAPYPVNVNDLLVLTPAYMHVVTADGKQSPLDGTSIFRLVHRHNRGETKSFLTVPDQDFEKRFQANNEKLAPEIRKIIDERNAKWKEISTARMKVFQELTENATVLRKKDLDKFLKDLQALPVRDSTSMMFTRMMITPNTPHAYDQLTCPKCKGIFHVLNGTDLIAPLGDLKTLLEKFDIAPDYSSICPKCHPGAEGHRRLNATFHISGREYPAQLSPADLIILCELMHNNRMFGPNEIARLCNILQGTPDETHVIARKAPEK